MSGDRVARRSEFHGSGRPAVQSAPIPEAAFQQRVLQYAHLCGWRLVHFRPARTRWGWATAQSGDVGFPDVVLVRRGRLVFLELKREKGAKVSDEQQAWIDELDQVAGVVAMVARPSDWPALLELLR